MLMSTMSSLNISISISIRKKLMLMLMSQLSSLAHKLLMLMFMLMLASLVRTGLKPLRLIWRGGCLWSSMDHINHISPLYQKYPEDGHKDTCIPVYKDLLHIHSAYYSKAFVCHNVFIGITILVCLQAPYELLVDLRVLDMS